MILTFVGDVCIVLILTVFYPSCKNTFQLLPEVESDSAVYEEISEMKFLIFIQSMKNMGGTEIATIKLVEGLGHHEVDANILSLEPYLGNLPYVRDLGDQVWREYAAIEQSFVNKLFHPRKKFTYLQNKIEEYCSNHQVDLFIHFTYGLFPANPRNVKTAAVLHWSVNGYEDSIRKIIHCKSMVNRLVSTFVFQRECLMNHQALEAIDYVIALTQSGKKEIAGINRHIDESKIHVIPNFVQHIASDSLLSNQDNKRVFFVGRLSIEKGCYRLLEIWEKVSLYNPEWSLEIYGSGQEEAGMKKMIQEKDLKNIHFHGFIKDMSSYYGSGDMLLCTSDSEGFGLVLIEAMQYGVVPITFDCPVSPRELVADGGEWVECFDIDAFADKVNQLCNNREKRLDLQGKAIRRSNDFLESNVIQLWKKLIRK